MTIYNIFLVLHIIGGFSALTAGTISIISKKGATWHKISGLIFYYGMLTVSVTAISISLFKSDTFLLHIGIFSLYMNVAGYRSIQDRTLKPNWIDWSILTIAIINSVAMIMSMEIVLMVFGGIGAFLALNDLKIYYWMSNGGKLPKMQWLRRHIAMMMGTYISAFTAFLVVNINLENNSWLVWLAPTFVFSPLIPYWIRKINHPKSKTLFTTILVLVLFISNKTLAHHPTTSKVITGFVTTAQKQPLSYTNIGIMGTSLGTISAPNGNFELHINTIDSSQIIRFSHIGYKDFEISLQEAWKKSPLNIVMVAEETTLQVIEISADKLIGKRIGSQKTNTNMNVYFSIGKEPNQNLGASIGKKFKVKKERMYLDSIGFFIRHNNFDTVRLRVNFYDLVQDRPANFLHDREIIIELINGKTGWITSDLSPHHIVLEDHFAVSVEWIYHSKKGKYLQMPIAMPMINSTHYYRFGSQNKWKKFLGMSAPIYLDVKVEKQDTLN